MPSSAPQKNYKESSDENFDRAVAIENIYLQSIKELEDKYERARARLGDAASEDPDCELLRAQLELARAECDRAGALKFKSFIRRHRELFEGRDGVAAIARRETESGLAYVPSPELENRRYLVLNVGELGRLNKDGHSQWAGDAGLEAAVTAVARVADDWVKGVTVYRYGGNEYMVEFADISEVDIRLFEERLLKEKLELKEFPDLEAPPLSVTEFGLAEVLDIMSAVDLNDPEIGERDAFEAAAESVSITTRRADYGLAVEKFTRGVLRAIAKIEAAKSGEISRGEAKVFFETYVKKIIYGSGLETLEDIEDLWRGGTDRADFDRAVDLLATANAAAQARGESKFDLYEKYLVDGAAREYAHVANRRETDALPHDFFASGTKLAKIPSPQYGTEGLRALVQKKRQIGSRQTGDAAVGQKWRAVDQTFYDAEVMKRDLGTGLFERGKFFEDLGGAIDENGELSLIFIDLGFLKYFNDAGRRAVGDAALLKAAEIMETALMESEVEGTAYRYGGDEFTVLVKGGRREAEEIKNAIKDLAAGAGRIPDLRSLREQGFAQGTTGDSRPDYAPRELVFNFGIAELGDVVKIMNDLGSDKLQETLEKNRRGAKDFQADLLVKLADASVGYEKAVSRFHNLLDMMAEPGYADENSAAHKRTEAVIAASRKAIFAGLGGEAALRFWAVGQDEENPAVLDEQIERFVSDRAEKMSEVLESEKAVVDKLVEVHAARNRLRAQVRELREELDKDDARIRELEIKVKEADRARQELINVRQMIAGKTIDKVS